MFKLSNQLTLIIEKETTSQDFITRSTVSSPDEHAIAHQIYTNRSYDLS